MVELHRSIVGTDRRWSPARIRRLRPRLQRTDRRMRTPAALRLARAPHLSPPAGVVPGFFNSFQDELQRNNLDLENFKDKIKENQEKIKLSKQLHYLAGVLAC